MAISTEDLEAQQDDLGTELPGGADEESSAEELAAQDTQLARQEVNLQGELTNLQRQLSRMESRFDRGGTDAASVRQLHQQIDQLSQRMDGIGELRELIDGLLEANVPPEKLAALKVKQAETRATRAETRAREADERATRTVSLPTATAPAAHMDQEGIEAANILTKRMERAGYDANDEATMKRLQAAVPGLASMSIQGRLNALTDAIADLQDADGGAAAQAGRRTAARGAVRADRTSAGGGGGGGGSYNSYEDLCTAHIEGRISTPDVARIKASKGW